MKDLLMKFFFTGTKVQILLHLAVWAILFFFPSYLMYVDSTRDINFLYHNYIQTLFYAIIFYVNFFILIPYLFFRRKNKIPYFVSAFLLILLMTLLMIVPNNYLMPGGMKPKNLPGPEAGVRQPIPPPTGAEFRVPPPAPMGPPREGEKSPGAPRMPKPFMGWPVYNFMLISFLISGFSLGLRFSDKLIKNEKRQKEIEKENLKTELSMLRNQINPHFLFNSLNTLYSLSLVKSDLTPDAIMKLSDMMRYVIQDAKRDQVPLDLEIEYIRHYVDLQKFRLSDNVDLQLAVTGDPGGFEIPPMILIPFVENSFKYGTSSHEKAVILIDIGIQNNMLLFKASNRIFEGREQQGTFGIGISNTRQRLALIYPGKHDLELTNNGKVFIVNLKIDLG
jgi:hypothetical protein